MSIVTLNDRAVRSVTTFGSLNTGSMVFIKKLTASSSSTLSFVNGSSNVVLDSTYKEYLFTFKNIHASTDDTDLTLQASTDGGSNYNTAITTTFFQAFNDEADSSTSLSYNTNFHQSQGTGFQLFSHSLGTDNDQSSSGTLTLFSPSSTTFVKHFISRMAVYHASDFNNDMFTAGYFNTTSSINAVQFVQQSGNLDSGDICLYGIL